MILVAEASFVYKLTKDKPFEKKKKKTNEGPRN